MEIFNDKKIIEELIATLKKGGLVIIPTDTVYGISADATIKGCAKKVNDAKKRIDAKPLNILVSDQEMLKKYVQEITPLEEEIISKLTPSKMTILFRKNSLINDEVTANSPFIAIRIPDNENLCRFIASYGKPLISTSANITGSDVVSNLDTLEDELKNSIDYIYDAGTLNTTPSTLIKVENEKIKILREGIMGKELRKEFSNFMEN